MPVFARQEDSTLKGICAGDSEHVPCTESLLKGQPEPLGPLRVPLLFGYRQRGPVAKVSFAPASPSP